MSRHGKGMARGNLDSRSGSKKTLKNGFGVVRRLTPASQGELYRGLDEAELGIDHLRRKPPAHLTVIRFLGLSKREQTAFKVGHDVGRLQAKLELKVKDAAPRCAMTVELGNAAFLGNVIYCEVDDDRVVNEQVQLAGVIALAGTIDIAKINRRIQPPHVAIGFVQGASAEEITEQVQETISGSSVTLEKWEPYPHPY